MACLQPTGNRATGPVTIAGIIILQAEELAASAAKPDNTPRVRGALLLLCTLRLPSRALASMASRVGTGCARAVGIITSLLERHVESAVETKVKKDFYFAYFLQIIYFVT